MAYTIALHGDLASAEMLRRDVGSLANSIDLFFDARGWLRFDHQLEKLLEIIAELPEPPILIGYSRGGSAIARLSEVVQLKAAVIYEGPVIDSEGVGGDFPVLMIWNDCGAKFGRSAIRRGQAKISQEIWSATHPLIELRGSGMHMMTRPPRHGWDLAVNGAVQEFLVSPTRYC